MRAHAAGQAALGRLDACGFVVGALSLREKGAHAQLSRGLGQRQGIPIGSAADWAGDLKKELMPTNYGPGV